MFGSYTAFELEAERRREVLASTMREVHGDQPALDDLCRQPPMPIEAPETHGLAAIAASLRSRVRQRT